LTEKTWEQLPAAMSRYGLLSQYFDLKIFPAKHGLFFMQLKNRADKIRKILRLIYPEVKPQLFYETPFQLLVATILSGQCTDKQVNRVTKELFQSLKTPRDFARAPVRTLESLIRPTGFYHNKAKHIKSCGRVIWKKYDDQMPQSLEEMIKLPGVGRKTANVVLGAAFGIPGVVVDTHVARISGRLELTENKDPVKIESDLMKIIPKGAWNSFSLQLIFFGRETCTAPACKTVFLAAQDKLNYI
jgi:endonuclease-3